MISASVGEILKVRRHQQPDSQGLFNYEKFFSSFSQKIFFPSASPQEHVTMHLFLRKKHVISGEQKAQKLRDFSRLKMIHPSFAAS
jgi:hypothetical protein